jgi:ADP-heptose:LPS heptosyltransferase
MFFTRLLQIKIFNGIASFLIEILLRFTRGIKIKRKGGKVVIISLHRLGDSVFTIPAIKKILNFHHENVYLVCFSEAIDIFKIALDKINYVGLSHNDFYFTDRIASRHTKKILTNLDPGLIYDLTGCVTSASLIYNSSAEIIIGINDSLYKSLYTTFIPKKIVNHITDLYNNVVIPLPELKIKSIVSDSDVPRGLILIHPFAGWSAKEWGLNKFIELTLLMRKDHEIAFILPGNKIDDNTIDELKKNNIAYSIAHNTKELIEEIKKCSIFIGNDSGPIHIANLLEKPTFTIYGPTNPAFHSPLIGKNNFIIKRIKCSPLNGEKMCFTLGGQIGCPSFECMNLLGVDEVKLELEKFLSETESKNDGLS